MLEKQSIADHQDEHPKPTKNSHMSLQGKRTPSRHRSSTRLAVSRRWIAEKGWEWTTKRLTIEPKSSGSRIGPPDRSLQ